MTAASRKRGGQPGNKNALKHGFYAAVFRSAECDDLEAMSEAGLTSEIAMLRVFTRRLFEKSSEVKTISDLIVLLDALGMASSRISGLLRVQHLLGSGQESGVAASISTALSDIAKELAL
jgi:hypothetical protein